MKTLKAIKFVFMAPFILLMLYVINWVVTPGQPWFKFAALGIGIAWFVSLLRVIKMVVLLGGIAAFGAWLANRK